MGPKTPLYTSLKVYSSYRASINFYLASILQVYLMPLLSSPDLISLVFCFLVLGIVKGVFLDSIFSFGIESSSSLSSISLTLCLVWRLDLYYLLEVLGSACSLFLPGSSCLVIPVSLVSLVLLAFLLGFVESAPFFLVRSG
jgi:hypothetical protein